MNSARYYIVGLSLVALAGCTTLTPEPEEVPMACPEPVVCPVCEAPPEPELCPEPEVVEKIIEVPAPMPQMASTAGKLHLPIIGSVERALIEPADIVLEARIDTATETSAIHAEDIQLVEKDGKRYVRYTLVDADKGKITQELPLRRRESVRQADGSTERSYIVRMWVSIGEMRSRIDIRLADRGEEANPLLIGRNFLLDTAIVDVSRKNTQPEPDKPSS